MSVLRHPATILVLILLITMIFGANRLPGAARSLGRSLRIFKSEVKQMGDDDKPGSSSADTARPVEGRVVDEPLERPTPLSDDAEASPRRP